MSDTPTNVISTDELKKISDDLDSKVKVTKYKVHTAKIKKNLKELVKQQKKELEELEKKVKNDSRFEMPEPPQKKSKVVLFYCSDFSPITVGDIQLVEAAKSYLETEQNAFVAGALLSPSHDQTVRKKHGDKYVHSKHRTTMMETVLNDSEWIDIDTWEISQPRIQPVATVANHLIELLREKIPGHKSLSLCVVTTAAAMIRSPLAGFDKKVVSVCVVGTASEKDKVHPIRENYEKNQGIKMYYATTQDALLTYTYKSLSLGVVV